MQEELALLLQAMPDEQRTRLAGRDFWRGHLEGQDVVVVLSRIGKVAAATTAALLLDRFDARALVFTGVAGGLAAGVAVGDAVVATELLQHDLDASPIFPRYEVPLTGCARFAADGAWHEALVRAAHAALADPEALLGSAACRRFPLSAPRGHRGLIVSGDRFVSSAAESNALRAALPDALAVEMEGAAVAQVCHDFGVPCAVVRIISDRADDDAHGDFQRFVAGVASHYSHAIVRGLLRQPACLPTFAARTG